MKEILRTIVVSNSRINGIFQVIVRVEKNQPKIMINLYTKTALWMTEKLKLIKISKKK